jgi:predicted PurR-regulated permease PerM
MTEQRTISPLLKSTIIAAGTVIIITAMMAWSKMVITLFLAFLLGVSIDPLIGWLEGKGLSKGLATVITIAIVLLVIAGLLGFLILSVDRLVTLLPTYADNIDSLKSDLQGGLSNLGVDTSGILDLARIDSSVLLGAGATFLAGIIGGLASLFTVLLIFFFIIIEASTFSVEFTQVFDKDNPMVARVSEFISELRAYITITTRINLLIGVVDAILLIILGVPFPFLWGLLAFFTGFIPAVGFWISMIPPLILALLAEGPTQALIVLVGYVVINGGIQNFLEPRLYGEGLNLNPLVIVLSLILWSFILGPVGALIAVPLTLMVMRLLLENFDETKSIAKMMGSEEK